MNGTINSEFLHSDLEGGSLRLGGYSDLGWSFRFRVSFRFRGLIRFRGHSDLGRSFGFRGSFRIRRVVQI